MNAIKLILKSLHLNREFEAVRHHFTFAEWTKRVLFGFDYNVHIKFIAYSDFTCATYDFQKSRENVIFEIA